MALWAAHWLMRLQRYYHDEELLRRLELAAAFIVREQHEDGTISPGWTNMHSPPDTAFAVVGLGAAAMNCWKHDMGALETEARADIRKLFSELSAPALLTGGCHTPNHRWVLTAALAFLHRLTGNAELIARADQWLAEGMDCTEDGEWTERSNGI